MRLLRATYSMVAKVDLALHARVRGTFRLPLICAIEERLAAYLIDHGGEDFVNETYFGAE